MGTEIKMTKLPGLKNMPLHGWIGLGLVGLFWVLNWSLPGLRTHWGFFPLWLGYCLLVDALVEIRKGESMLSRSFGGYVMLFFISSLNWWLFEVINWRTQNWHYIGREFFTDFQYFTLASLSFSTVMPAVFGTAELLGTFGWVQRFRNGIRVSSRFSTMLLFFCAGWLMLALLLVWPRYFFPLVWIALFFILEPLSYWLGNNSLVPALEHGDWRQVVSLWAGGLICGFFWEMWNYYSFPKWIYTVPFVDFAHIFEMPLLGYGGYLPFSLELYALYHLSLRILGIKKERTLPPNPLKGA